MWMKNSLDADQLASDEASWSGSTLFSKEGIEFLKKKSYVHMCVYKVEYGIYKLEI